jgi:hypothetical protein
MTEDQAGFRITVDRPGGGRSPRRRPDRWLVLFVVVLVLGALWSFRGEVTPDANQPIDVDSLEVVTTSTRPPLEGDLSRGWVAIDLPGDGEIVEIVDTRFGIFAVAVDVVGATLWRSDSGVTWDLVVTADEVFASAEVNAIVETEVGLVAVGAWTDEGVERYEGWGQLRERRSPAAWISIDGENWERVPNDQIERSLDDDSLPADDRDLGAMSDVVVWEGRLVAVGWSSSRDHRGAAWVADLDGRNWTVATKGLAGSGTAFTEATGVSVFEGGLVAVGSTLSRPSVWVSPDAMTWSSIDPHDALGSMQHDRPARVTAGGAGLVAVGAHRLLTSSFVEPPGSGFSVIWLSRDGEEWLRLAPDQLAGVLLEDLVAVDPWLVAVGTSGDGYSTTPGVWFSASGAEWQGVDLGLDGYEWGNPTVKAIVRGGPGLVVGGTVQGYPELWVWSSEGSIKIPDSAWVRPESGRWVLRSEFDPGFPVGSIGVIPNGYVAIGEGVVWRSVDGVAWERTPIEETGLAFGSWYSSPVTIDGTVYVVAETGGIWSSADGRSWIQLAEGFAGHLEGPFPGRDGELLLIERPKWETFQDETQRLWRSADGVRWTELSLPALDWVAGIDFVGDRYLVRGGSESWPSTVWSSMNGSDWDPVELAPTFDDTGQVAMVDGRLMMPVVVGRDWPATSMLSTSDGIIWDLADIELPGWPSQVVPYDSGVLMMLEGPEQSGYSMPASTLWDSVDGVQWIELGPPPTYRDSWPRILSHSTTIQIVLESEDHVGLWEWVPPAG